VEVRATFAASFRRLADRPELIDGALDDATLLNEVLRDLQRVNRWLGGAALSRSALVALLARSAKSGLAGSPSPIRVLDVGTGSADIPVELLRWASAHGVSLEIEAVDSREEMVDAARVEHGTMHGLRIRVADARSLPYPDAAFDVAHTSLLAHHLEPTELAASLTELSRVSAIGVIVNDLDRTVIGLAGAWFLSRIFTRNRLTRHDGPLSVRRAYRPAELREIAARAGLAQAVIVRGFVGHRYAMALVPVAVGTASGTERPANIWS
jgi:ubiquinone/menaquinone biosynthesis C-methylase UbiE